MKTPTNQIIAFGVAFTILFGSALTMGWAINAFDLYLSKEPIYAENGRTLRAVAAETEHWEREGVDHIDPIEIQESLGTDNYLTRTYRLKAPETGEPTYLRLHAAYYTGMIDTVPHVPERCLAGAGWVQTEDWGVVDVPLEGENWTELTDLPEGMEGPVYQARLSNRYSDLPGTRVPLPAGITPEGGLRMQVSEFAGPGGRKWFAGYFFIANGGTVPRAEQVRLLSFKLTDDYAYYLKVQFDSDQVSSAQELAALAGHLLDDLLGEIMLCVPDWARVTRGEYPPSNPRRERADGA